MKKCLNCGNEIAKNKKFCNSSCSATFNNKQRKLSDETKKKISSTMKSKRDLPRQEICDLYLSGKSTIYIKLKFGIARSTVSSILEECGIIKREIVLKRFCDKHNEDYTPYRNGKYVCKKCQVKKISEYRRQLKVLAVEYKGSKCQMCGYDKCIAALEFHHLDPTKKDFTIANSGHIRSFNNIIPELDKCILLCSNCHREEHDRLRKNEDE